MFERDAGAKIMGECCTTTPAQFKAVITALDGTTEQLFVSKILIVALGSTWKGFDGFDDGNAARGGRRDRRH